jgi:hypothetical protein
MIWKHVLRATRCQDLVRQKLHACEVPWFHHDVNTHASSHVHAWWSRPAGRVRNTTPTTSGHLDSPARLQLASPPTTSTIFHFSKAKCYFQFNICTTSNVFVDYLRFFVPPRPSTTCSTCFLALPIPPPRHAQGLGMPTRRSPDLRVQIFFLSCAMFPLPLTRSGAWPCQSNGLKT